MDQSDCMDRALQLARLGLGTAAPNPLVGAVLVQGDRILAEGWHRHPGGPHAEVDCLRAFGDGPVPADAVLYVSLEPCVHHGRTPPCTELLIARGVRHVVIPHADPFPAVSGRGIARMREAGIQVEVGVEEAQARWSNRRFLTSIGRQRPYIILKWARSADGFLDRHPRAERGVQRITSPASDALVHRWRSEEQAILVGSRTALNDDPALNVRHVDGPSPLRVVLDRQAIAPDKSKVFSDGAATLLFTGRHRPELSVEQHLLSPSADPLRAVLAELDRRNIRSLLVEGGAELIGHFLAQDLWDEARVFTGPVRFEHGTVTPVPGGIPQRTQHSGPDLLHLHVNGQAPSPTWCW